MTQIDFYTQVGSPTDFACRLAQTVYAKGERLLIAFACEEDLQAFSRRLWSIGDVAFVPHCRVGAAESAATPIWLGTAAEVPVDAPAVLLNLADGQSLEAGGAFRRILEIVATDEHSLSQARERYRIYRANGFVINHHDMSNR